jgi:large conductance mechanosensitive channel
MAQIGGKVQWAMSVWNDFKLFAFKGNVVDLAVGVVIGASFGKIVSALVGDFIMPIVALAMPAGDWRDNGIILREGATVKDNVVLKYGDFLGTALDFFIIAFVLFILVSKVVKAAEGRIKGPDIVSTKPCAWCTESIPLAAKKCKFCCSDVAPASSAA